MLIGTYADGRPLNYDETRSLFDVGGSFVTIQDVLRYDQAGAVVWLSDDFRTWAYALSSGPDSDGLGVGIAPDQPITVTKRGKLFGFRSRRIWKMAVASVYYAACGLAGLGVFASVKPYAIDTRDIVLDVVSYLIVVLVLLSPAFLLSDFGYRQRLPFFKRRKFVWSAVGLVVVCTLLSATVAFAGTLHSAPYKVAAEQERIALQKKQDAERQATAAAEVRKAADAKRLAGNQRSAEASRVAEAKKLADAKKSAEASKAADAAMKPKAASAPKAAPNAVSAGAGHVLPAYTIASVEDVSIGTVKRYTYHVVVTENPTVGDLATIADKVIEKAKSERPFNSLIVGFYDYPQYIGSGYIFGKVEYAPNGDWGAAKDVSTGDYSTMRPVRDLEARDWSKRLTSEEVKVWAAWQGEYSKRDAALPPGDMTGVDEARLSSDIGKKFGLSAGQVDTILDKQMRWQFP